QTWFAASVVTDDTSPNTLPAGSCGNEGSNWNVGTFVCAAGRSATAHANSTQKKTARFIAVLLIVAPTCATSFVILWRLFQRRVRGGVVVDPHLRLLRFQERVDVDAALRRLVLVELEAWEPVHRLLFRVVIQIAGDDERTELVQLEKQHLMPGRVARRRFDDD